MHTTKLFLFLKIQLGKLFNKWENQAGLTGKVFEWIQGVLSSSIN